MSRSQRRLAAAGLCVVGIAGIYLARHILVPFLLASVVAYALNPAVAWLQRHGISRAYGTFLVMAGLLLGAVLALMIAVPEMISQLAQFMDRLPGYVQAVNERLRPLESYLQERYPEQLEALKTQGAAAAQRALPAAAGWVIGGLTGIAASAMGLFIWLLTIVVIPVFAYYLLADYVEISNAVTALIPSHLRPGIDRRVAEIDRVLRSWLKGQLTVAVVLAVIYAVGLTILGVPVGLLIGVIGGLANLVPYLGLVVGFLPAALLSFLDTGSWVGPVLVAGVFTLGQVLEGTVITPRVVGSGLGMPPLLVLLAVMVGGDLFGFTGLLLAVPTTAAGMVLLKELRTSFERPTGRPESAQEASRARRPTQRRRPLA
ncbi:MAG TPA: AI-2E family transporter [Candidatus Polarisedimenticolia bacterium]|nr:AI-2E family transporter [Candidatus Polarisedimenticolia bacterium]